MPFSAEPRLLSLRPAMTYSLHTLNNTKEAPPPPSGLQRFVQEIALTAGLVLLLFWLVAMLSHSAQDPAWTTSGSSLTPRRASASRSTGLRLSSSSCFIRPSPSSGTLGGVAAKTREAMLLCEAAGFDVIIIETVGVGQSETTVAALVDFFLVLLLASSGDELQGIKKGILELADMVAVNKADSGNEDRARIAPRDRSRSSPNSWNVPSSTMDRIRSSAGIRK